MQTIKWIKRYFAMKLTVVIWLVGCIVTAFQLRSHYDSSNELHFLFITSKVRLSHAFLAIYCQCKCDTVNKDIQICYLRASTFANIHPTHAHSLIVVFRLIRFRCFLTFVLKIRWHLLSCTQPATYCTQHIHVNNSISFSARWVCRIARFCDKRTICCN